MKTDILHAIISVRRIFIKYNITLKLWCWSDLSSIKRVCLARYIYIIYKVKKRITQSDKREKRTKFDFAYYPTRLCSLLFGSSTRCVRSRILCSYIYVHNHRNATAPGKIKRDGSAVARAIRYIGCAPFPWVSRNLYVKSSRLTI